MKNLFKALRQRLRFYLAKKKNHETEEEFYTYLFTRHPGWNSPEANEDESIRWKAIESVLQPFKARAGLRILEIGCGRGWMSNKLTAYGKVTAIDPIAPVINYARKLFPHINFSATDLPGLLAQNPGEKFDLILSTEVLEHIADKKSFLNSVHAALHKGGTIILTTPRMEHYEDFKEAFGIDPAQPVEEWLTEKELEHLFKDSAFEIVQRQFFAPLPLKDREVLITQLWVCKSA